jgi:hypothetical protein
MLTRKWEKKQEILTEKWRSLRTKVRYKNTLYLTNTFHKYLSQPEENKLCEHTVNMGPREIFEYEPTGWMQNRKKLMLRDP